MSTLYFYAFLSPVQKHWNQSAPDLNILSIKQEQKAFPASVIIWQSFNCNLSGHGFISYSWLTEAAIERSPMDLTLQISLDLSFSSSSIFLYFLSNCIAIFLKELGYQSPCNHPCQQQMIKNGWMGYIKHRGLKGNRTVGRQWEAAVITTTTHEISCVHSIQKGKGSNCFITATWELGERCGVTALKDTMRHMLCS